MGIAPSIPTDPNKTLRVIGGGYIRTGTLSFSLACSRLLRDSSPTDSDQDAPSCHGGAQVLGREDAYVKLLAQCYLHRNDKPRLHKLLRQATQGFVATADFPFAQFAPDLLEIYPDAVVVVTTRDREKWWASAEPVAANAQSWFLDVLLWPCPGWRWWPTLMQGVRETECENVGMVHSKEAVLPSIDSITKHEDWLRRTIPKDKLFFYEVKDGWAPLCKMLDVPVPRDAEGKEEPFPRANDAGAADAVFKKVIFQAGLVWLVIIGATGLGIWGLVRWL